MKVILTSVKIPNLNWFYAVFMQVRAFLQLGRNGGKESLSVAVDVATNLMLKKGITPSSRLTILGITSHTTTVVLGRKVAGSTNWIGIWSGLGLQ